MAQEESDHLFDSGGDHGTQALFTFVDWKAQKLEPGKKCSDKSGAFLQRKGFEKKETKLCFVLEVERARARAQKPGLKRACKF